MANGTFKIFAVHQSDGQGGVTAQLSVPTLADAEAIAVLFPKSVKVYAGNCRGNVCSDFEYRHGDPDNIYREFGTVTFNVYFTKDGVTGHFNETGLKRYRSFRRNLDKLGFQVKWATPYANSFQTEADFESYLTQEA